jgi:hypothetical protein
MCTPALMTFLCCLVKKHLVTESAYDCNFSAVQTCKCAQLARGKMVHHAAINSLLNGDMRSSFQLQVALAGVLAVVIVQGSLDVHGVRVVTFNELRVVAVHRSHQVCKRSEKGRLRRKPADFWVRSSARSVIAARTQLVSHPGGCVKSCDVSGSLTQQYREEHAKAQGKEP